MKPNEDKLPCLCFKIFENIKVINSINYHSLIWCLLNFRTLSQYRYQNERQSSLTRRNDSHDNLLMISKKKKRFLVCINCSKLITSSLFFELLFMVCEGVNPKIMLIIGDNSKKNFCVNETRFGYVVCTNVLFSNST